jgi:outer membrane immunogenic protein
MKRVLVIGAAVIAMVAGPAFAADMPLKAPPAPVPVAPSWTGFYLGGEVGQEWSKNQWDPTCIQGAFACGTPGNNNPLRGTFPGEPDGNANFDMSGVRYGIYSGWMFQAYDRWVFGAEADYAFHSQTKSVGFLVGCSSAACQGPNGNNFPGPFFGDSTSLKLGDDTSFRVRAGFLVTPDLQIYAAGGPAAQKVEATVVCSNTGAANCGFLTTDTFSSHSEKWLAGFTVGGGLEWRVWNNILLRGEYRYNDYGTWKQQGSFNFLTPPGAFQVQEFADVHVKTQVATFGIAYLFQPPHW